MQAGHTEGVIVETDVVTDGVGLIVDLEKVEGVTVLDFEENEVEVLLE